MSKGVPGAGETPPSAPPTPPKGPGKIASWKTAFTNFLKDALRFIGFEWKTASFEKPESKSETISKIAQKTGIDQKKLGFLKKLRSNDLNFLLRAIQTDTRAKKNFEMLINDTKWGPSRVLSSFRLAPTILKELPTTASEKEEAALLADLLLTKDLGQLEKQIKELKSAQKKSSHERAKPTTPEERNRRADLQNPPDSRDRINYPLTTKNMLSAIYQKTYPSNIQVLEYALQAMHTPMESADTRKHASTGRGGGSFALQEEIHLPQLLLKDSGEILTTFPHVEIVISQPGTLNTMVLKLPLPNHFKGMTVTEARSALTTLQETARTMGQEGELWAQKWVQEATAKMMDAFSSFSPEGMRFKRPDLSSPKAAIEAAKEQHTFQMTDGRHSLLPAISEEPSLQSCVTISQDNVDKLSGSKQTTTLPSKVTTDGVETVEATCTIGYEEVAGELAKITTTIEDPSGNKTERITYRARENMTKEAVMEKYRTSGLFERDLLLAKAEYMQQHTEIG